MIVQTLLHGVVEQHIIKVNKFLGKLVNSVRLTRLLNQRICSLRWPVHRRVLQWHAHGTFRSLTVLPMRYDLTRGGTVGIWRERRREETERGKWNTCTADGKGLAKSKLNTTIDLLGVSDYLSNHSKLIVVSHCQLCLLQDFEIWCLKVLTSNM